MSASFRVSGVRLALATAAAVRSGGSLAAGSVRVPCAGHGEVEFSSCPYLAPCPCGWVPDMVKARWENVAVAPSALRARHTQ